MKREGWWVPIPRLGLHRLRVIREDVATGQGHIGWLVDLGGTTYHAWRSVHNLTASAFGYPWYAYEA